LTGLEAAAVEGAVSLQAEYVRSDVSRSNVEKVIHTRILP